LAVTRAGGARFDVVFPLAGPEDRAGGR